MAEAPSLRGDDPIAAEVRLNRLLNMILESAVEALGFDAATVTARDGQDFATVAATDQRLVALDDAQYETGEGRAWRCWSHPSRFRSRMPASSRIGGSTSAAPLRSLVSTRRFPCTCRSTRRASYGLR